MGTINYMTSDYITLGVKPYSAWDFLEDAGTLAEIKDAIMEDGLHDSLEEITDDEVDDYIYWLIGTYYEDDRINVEAILDKYCWRYFSIKIEPGYYEGFSLDITYDYDGDCFDDYEEKRQAQREVTQVKECLIDLAGVGLKACSPGWCTSYRDYAGTINKINEAVKQMRLDVKNTHTYRTWEQDYNRQAKEDAGWLEHDKYLLRDF